MNDVKIKHPPSTILEYDYITDGMYIGTNQCCRTHFDETLKKKGITAVISLEKGKVDTPFGVDFYSWIPVEDHTPPTMDQLAFGVSALAKLVSLHQKIYVHCQNGHGRAPTLVAAYLIRKGESPGDAEEFIKSRRPAIHLEDSQREALIKFNRNKKT